MEDLQDDMELVLTAIQQDPQAVEDASETLRNNKAVMMAAVEKAIHPFGLPSSPATFPPSAPRTCSPTCARTVFHALSSRLSGSSMVELPISRSARCRQMSCIDWERPRRSARAAVLSSVADASNCSFVHQSTFAAMTVNGAHRAAGGQGRAGAVSLASG